MSLYHVTLTRPAYSYMVIQIEAGSEAEAEQQAVALTGTIVSTETIDDESVSWQLLETSPNAELVQP